MSAFDFANETPDNNNNGSSQFTFGEEQPEEQHPTQKAAPTKKAAPGKKGMRVIGIGKKKSTETKKPNKFAKKGTEKSETKQKISVQLTPGQIPELGEIKNPTIIQAPPKEDDTSAFDFGSAEPTSNQNDEVSAFDFGQAEATPASNETSAFDFGAASTENQAEATSSFDFGGSAPAPAQPPVQTRSVPTPEPVAQQSQPAADVPPEIQELGETYGGFALSLNNIALAVQDMIKETASSKEEITNSEKAQADALSNEEYDKAEQLDNKISQLKEKIHENENNFALCVQEALDLTTEAPNHLMEHATSASSKLPELTSRASAVETELSEKNELQTRDNTTIDIERRKNASKIQELETPINMHAKAIDDMQAKYDSDVSKATESLDTQITALENERRDISTQVSDLLKQIDALRTREKSVQAEINKHTRSRKQIVDGFSADLKKINQEKQSLESEKRKMNAEIKKIEAPFQSLLDDVAKREKEINALNDELKTLKEQIENAQRDTDEAEKGAELITGLIQSYGKYNEERSSRFEQMNSDRNEIIESRQKVSLLSQQLIQLNTDLKTSEELVAGAKAKEEQLEAQKKAAVASKNFKAAKTCNDQLKDLKEVTERAETTITTSAAKIAQNQEESAHLTDKIHTLETALVDEKDGLSKIDYEFFEEAVGILEKLFEVSRFSGKLLKGLQSMLQSLLDNTEKPVELSKDELKSMIDELNAKIEEAVEKENFDDAETLQVKVNALMTKYNNME